MKFSLESGVSSLMSFPWKIVFFFTDELLLGKSGFFTDKYTEGKKFSNIL